MTLTSIQEYESLLSKSVTVAKDCSEYCQSMYLSSVTYRHYICVHQLEFNDELLPDIAMNPEPVSEKVKKVNAFEQV